jgi:hypothetical protein
MTARRPAHPRTPTRGRQPTRARRHPFAADPTIPTDQHGRDYCQHCGVAGKPGDRKHLTDDEVAAQAAEERRRQGERDE